MKQLLSVLLVLCLLLGLAACGKKDEPIEKETPATTENKPEPEPTPAPEKETEQETETETEEDPVIRHPLNGSVLEEEWTGRVTTVVLGNSKDALPQCGINEADIMYEAETEGGTTRFLAVYDEVETLVTVGPIRSARTFFNNVTQSYGGVIIHCGGSVRGRNGYHDLSGNKISGWEHVDARYHDAGAEKYKETMFYRDAARSSAGYNYEHTMFITGQALVHLINKYEYATTSETALNSGLAFAETVALEGTAANTAVVNFAVYKTTTFTYDQQTGLYSAAQYGENLIDGNTNEVSQFKNLLVLSATQHTKSDGEYPRSYYDLVGSGKGYLVIDGQSVAINWSRETLESPFSYTLEDGSAVQLAPGRTYIAITSASEPLTCQ